MMFRGLALLFVYAWCIGSLGYVGWKVLSAGMGFS